MPLEKTPARTHRLARCHYKQQQNTFLQFKSFLNLIQHQTHAWRIPTSLPENSWRFWFWVRGSKHTASCLSHLMQLQNLDRTHAAVTCAL